MEIMSIMSFKPTIRTNQSEDTLARQSDVTVSTNTSLYGEYKGFFINVISGVILTCFILWTLVPDFVFEHTLSIDYLPDKYWSIAIPSYSLILMLYIYIALALYNSEVLTFPLNDVRNFVDEHTVLPGENRNLPGEDIGYKLNNYVHLAPSGVRELPITLVNEVLYSECEEPDEFDENNEYGLD